MFSRPPPPFFGGEDGDVLLKKSLERNPGWERSGEGMTMLERKRRREEDDVGRVEVVEGQTIKRPRVGGIVLQDWCGVRRAVGWSHLRLPPRVQGEFLAGREEVLFFFPALMPMTIIFFSVFT
jgi:hypothetical protein